MSFLRNLESKISNIVEGSFSRAFSSEVRPIEIARKLAREMEEHKSSSLARTYVPNEYRVFLSPRDRQRLGEYEDALIAELSGYLLEHARRENFAMLVRPVIEFHTDERLRLGEFGIQTRVTHPDGEEDEYEDAADAGGPPAGGLGAPPARPPSGYQAPSSPYQAPPSPYQAPPGSPPSSQPRRPLSPPGVAPDLDEAAEPQDFPPSPVGPSPGGGRTMVYGSAERISEPLEESARARSQTAILVSAGKRLVVGSGGVTVGRSRQCEIMLEDPNVSRRHAELRPRGGSWVLTDLGSTNGSRVNGRMVSGPTVVKPGDEIELGTAVLRFELE